MENKVRKIIHIDMDAFFASVEIHDNPKLKGRPIAVGGSPKSRGVIATASYEARKFGVRSAISSYKAKKLCPQLIIIEPHFDRYCEESEAINKIFRMFTDIIEPLSLDEAFLDVTDTKEFHGSATLIAREIKRLIHKERGLTASAGVAPNKFLAKVASDWKKPNGLFVIKPGDVDIFVKKLPVEKIFGVGKVTAGRLHEKNIFTCGDVQKYSKDELNMEFGSWGESLYEMSRGIDDRPVESEWERKSFSIENTFEHDLKNLNECLGELPSLFRDFKRRFEEIKDDVEIKGIFIKIKFKDFKSTTVERRAMKNPSISNFSKLVEEGFERGNKPVRLLGLGVRTRDKAFYEPGEQLEFPFNYE